MMTRLSYVLLVYTMFAFSCRDNPVLTDLNPINEAIIENMQPIYQIGLGETLTIRPQVTFTLDSLQADTSRYQYEWIFIVQPPVGSEFPYETIGQEKDLVEYSMEINQSQAMGFFDFTYRITDSYSDTFTEFPFRVIVGNAYFEGWLLLTEHEGKPQIDMLSYQANADTFAHLQDIVSLPSSDTPVARPVFIDFSSSMIMGLSMGGLTLGNDHDVQTYTLDEHQFSGSLYDDNLRLSQVHVDDRKSPRYYGKVYNHYLHVNRTFYQKNEIIGQPAGGYNPISFRQSPSGEAVLFSASSYLGVNLGDAASINVVVMFDEDTNEFLWCSEAQDVCNPLTHVNLIDPAEDWSLLYLAYTKFGGGQYLAVLKDITRNETYVMRFTLYELLSREQMSQNSQLALSNHMAIDPTTGRFYFSNANVLYTYRDKYEQELIQFDREVNMLKFNEFLMTGSFQTGSTVNKERYDQYERLLLISTQHPNRHDGSGQFLIYDPSQDRLTESHSGFGRIIDVTYKER